MVDGTRATDARAGGTSWAVGSDILERATLVGASEATKPRTLGTAALGIFGLAGGSDGGAALGTAL